MYLERTKAKDAADDRKICPACSAVAGRDSAKFCLVCGKMFSEGYEPLDSIRSSYGLQRMELSMNLRTADAEQLFEPDSNAVSDTAWACVVYSMVPYLGILFVPLAFAAGTLGVYVSYRRPGYGGRQMAMICLGLSVVILTIQIFLWWLLYVIPEIGI